MPLARGETAPFDGVLLPESMVLRLGSQVESCEFKLKLNAETAKSLAELNAETAALKLKLSEENAVAQLAISASALSASEKRAERGLMENPWLWTGIGIASGIALTVGSVLLVGQLRPLIPAPAPAAIVAVTP